MKLAILLGLILFVVIVKAIDFHRYWMSALQANDELIDRLYKQREELIDNACEWLSKQGQDWWEGYGIPFTIEDFKKAMEDYGTGTGTKS